MRDRCRGELTNSQPQRIDLAQRPQQPGVALTGFMCTDGESGRVQKLHLDRDDLLCLESLRK